MHAVVQPFATIVMRTLLWMKETFRVNYGWVLVIFGIVIRLALWPLNQKAMRSSIQMQRLQPELTEIQRKYKDDREKQQQAMMKLYASHGMSPLSPMLGCLPMLLPTPVLFALYFVFQNTIEFGTCTSCGYRTSRCATRTFIMPILMGASMFLLSWIGMRGVPPNPQAKMMSYMMPVMFVFFFFNLAAGLNLYYFVQNIAALPQQLPADAGAREGETFPVPKTRRGENVGHSGCEGGGVQSTIRLRFMKLTVHRSCDAAARNRRRERSSPIQTSIRSLAEVLPRVSPPASRLEKLPSLDALLLTHAHADHLSFDSLDRLPRNIPALSRRRWSRDGPTSSLQPTRPS
jgi:YidC/Oxa1 family membrane protein insertase